MSLVIVSLFTKCKFGYERKRPSLLLSCDLWVSNISLRTRRDEMITFDRGYFCAAMSISVWKCSKHASRGDFSTSFVPVCIIMAEGVPKCSLFKRSIADAIVGENNLCTTDVVENFLGSIHFPLESMRSMMSPFLSVSVVSLGWMWSLWFGLFSLG